MCNKPQKHAAVIKKWADGAKIQYKSESDGNWVDTPNPTWADWLEYRIKPEPKPDTFRYLALRPAYDGYCFAGTIDQCGLDNVKATFDGETGRLKKLEIIK